MKSSLRGLFKSYGEVVDVVAHSNLRMRGQAFVSFENADVAKRALTEVQRFPLYSKPMVRATAFLGLHILTLGSSTHCGSAIYTLLPSTRRSSSKSRLRGRDQTQW
jgi:RNA recognition motif-containing protein